jgi:hypothetical protein
MRNKRDNTIILRRLIVVRIRQGERVCVYWLECTFYTRQTAGALLSALLICNDTFNTS